MLSSHKWPFFSESRYHPWKNNILSEIYVGKLPIRPQRLVHYLLFCQQIFFESMTWLKAYTAFSWFDEFYSAILKTVSLCMSVCTCALQIWIVSFQLECILKIEKQKNVLLLKRLQYPSYQLLRWRWGAPVVSSWNWIWSELSSPPAGTEVRSGMEQPGSHEAETAPTQRPPLPQPHFGLAAAGCHPAPSLEYQEVRFLLEICFSRKLLLLWLSKT